MSLIPPSFHSFLYSPSFSFLPSLPPSFLPFRCQKRMSQNGLSKLPPLFSF
jgi:hypothetical protein